MIRNQIKCTRVRTYCTVRPYQCSNVILNEDVVQSENSASLNFQLPTYARTFNRKYLRAGIVHS